MTFKRLVLLALVFAQVTAPVFAKQPKHDAGAVSFQALPDPGFEQPPIDTSDYSNVTLAVSGNGTIAGHIRVVLDSGEVVPCSESTDVLLYPDTHLTEWVLARWAADVNGRYFGIASQPKFDPHIRVPAWLAPSYVDPDHVVRIAHCSESNGYFQFKNVPKGRYLVEASITRYGGALSAVHGGSTLVETQTPGGPQMSIVVGGSSVGGGPTPSDDYIVIGKFPVNVSAGSASSFVFSPGDLKIVSHAYDQP